MFNPLTILLLISLGIAGGGIVCLAFIVSGMKADIEALKESRDLALKESKLALKWRLSADDAIKRLEEFKADVLRNSSEASEN